MMSKSSIIILLFCVAMIAASFLIGVWAKKKATTAQAYFGGTAMFGPLAVGLSSMAGVASAFALVGVPGLIYSTGNAMTFWMLGSAAFAASYIILGKKMRGMAEVAEISSLGDVCDVRFNNNRIIKALMSIIICLGCVGYLAAQISAGTALFSNLIDVPPIVAGLIIFGLLTIYTALSGEVGGLLSQAFQGAVMVFAGIVLIIMFFGVTGGFGNILDAVASVGEVTGPDGVTKTFGPDFLNAWGTYPGGISLTWMLIPLLGCVGQPQVLTRMYAVKNPLDLPKTGLVTGVTHAIVSFLCVAMGYGAIYLVATGTIDPLATGDDSIYAFVDYCGLFAQMLAYAAILAAALSSASMFLTSSSTLLSKDLPSALGVKIAPEKQITVSRIFMVILGVIAIVVSVYSSELVGLLGTFGWGTLVSGTFPVFIVGLLWDRCSEKGVIAGLTYSVVFNILPLVTGFAYPSTLPGYFITTAVAVALTVIVSLIVPKKELNAASKAVLDL